MRLPGWEDTATVLFWLGSELDIRGPEVQTCQSCQDHKENRLSLLHINCQRYSHQQKKGHCISSSPWNSSKLSFIQSLPISFSLFLLSLCPLKSSLCHLSSVSLVSRRQDFAAIGHSLLADKVKKKNSQSNYKQLFRHSDYKNCKGIGHGCDAEVMLVNCIWQLQIVQPLL